MSGGGHFTSLLAAQAAPLEDAIPVSVLTGFLGSGKTTLLNRLLALPDLHGTAVVVNEFGAVGIDHDLIAQAREDVVLLDNGCMCCAVRTDLVEALGRLAQAPKPPARILIETSGLAEPAPIVHTLLREPALKDRFRLAGVACTADAVLAMGTLDRHPEAVRQVALADEIFLTKTDLLQGPADAGLLERLRAINPAALVHQDSDAYPQRLRAMVQGAGREGAATSDAFAYRTFAGAGSEADVGTAPVPHRDGITSFVLVRDEPLPREGFFAWLDTVVAMRGDDLLRMKGIVHLAEQPGQPLVVHGVQHLFHPPRTLPAWPSDDQRTRIVFITRGVDAQSLDETLSVFTRRRRRP